MDKTSDSGTKAVLFDIDGTLVDSNYLHVDAWDRAFTAVGHPVDVWRIHRAIGMDSGKLLKRLLEGDAEIIGDDAKARHDTLYMNTTDRLRPIGGGKALLEELTRRGHRVVLATSAPEDELKMLLAVLDVDDTVQAVTSSEDVGNAKPDPDIIRIALQKAGVSPREAVMVGDSVWDVEAADRAGVRCVGVLSGGVGREELLSAGASAVYEDVAELLHELSSSPIAGVTP
jgi:HAD superfamily hydrolase (TIGR01549 family)